MVKLAKIDIKRADASDNSLLTEELPWLVKAIAITTAMLAAIATLAALRAGSTLSDALTLQAQATRLQAEAAEQWAFYQAKGVAAAVQEASETAWVAAGKEPPTAFAGGIRKYQDEQTIIAGIAREKEGERDKNAAAGDRLFAQHDRYVIILVILQTAIAIGAVAALTRWLLLWIGSSVLGFCSSVILLVTWIH